MSKSWVLLCGLLCGSLAMCAVSLAEVVTLKDGRVIVAKKVVKSGGKVYVITDKGKETFAEDQIASIVEGNKPPAAPSPTAKSAGSTPTAAPASQPKELKEPATPVPDAPSPAAGSPSGVKETVVENMEMLYKLGKYGEVVSAADGNVPPTAKLKVKQLVARAYCRQGKFEEAKDLYKELSNQGTPAERTLAKACHEILSANPDGTFKGVAGKSAAELMKSDVVKSGKPATSQPAEASGTLQNEKVFAAALRAYAIVMLKDGEPLMDKLQKSWKPELTCADFERGRGSKAALHYDADKKKLIALYDQADLVSANVSASVRKELVRLEAEHIDKVLRTLADKIEEIGPRGPGKLYKQEVETGKIGTTEQKRWQEATDQALMAGNIALSAAGYMVNLYKLNETDFAEKIKEAEANVAQIKGQMDGLRKERNIKFLR